MDELRPELEKRKQQGLYRHRHIIQSAQGASTLIDGNRVLSFCSNDYLGLADNDDIKQAFITALDRYGLGSGAAHLVNGHSQLHHDCETLLAEFTGRDRALLFSTGYMANVAIPSALLSRHDFIFQDKLNHASLIDSARLCDARQQRYRHNDLQQLQRLLLKQGQQPHHRRMIISDAVFSMDGDSADVARLAQLAQDNKCMLMLDDAHGFGVLGKSGAGLCEALGATQQQVPVLMATLGKAVGVSGAFVAGSDSLIETLIQKARSYIYTTASPPATAAAVIKSIQIIQQQSWRREKLFELINYFRQQAGRLDCDLLPSDTAIQPIIIGENQKALDISRSLFEQGIHVTAIRPPTVPPGTSRLRITLSAKHEKSHIDQLINKLAKLIP